MKADAEDCKFSSSRILHSLVMELQR